MYSLKSLEDFVSREAEENYDYIFRHIEYVIDMAFTDSETQDDFDWFFGGGPKGTGYPDFDLLIKLTLLYKADKYGKFLDVQTFKTTIEPSKEPKFLLFDSGSTEERTEILKKRQIEETPSIFEGLGYWIREKDLNNA